MTIILILISLIAGFGIGASLCLYYWHKEAERERKLWINKVLIRDGQARLFSDSMITESDAVPERAPISPPVVTQSPYRAGLNALKATIKADKRAAPLPDGIKERIQERIKLAKGA